MGEGVGVLSLENLLLMRPKFFSILPLFIFFIPIVFSYRAEHRPAATPKRIIVIMFDGFGMSYYNSGAMPLLKTEVEKGFFKEVSALMPTVTNANNASICTGTFPEINGITGNSFLDENGKEEYMEHSRLLMAPTLFEKLKKKGVRSALISSKKKSTFLLPAGAEVVLSPETADSTWTRRIGTAPNIYSPDVNYWSMEAALYLLKNRPELGCLYIHTTDYPMHTWAPEENGSREHLQRMDWYIRKLREAAPDAMILITADHDVNHKSRCVDLERTLAAQQVPIRIAISAERDKYLKHHRGFGGTSYVYLNAPADAEKVTAALKTIKGVKSVLTRAEAAKKYKLLPARIGDLVVLADRETVFGTLETPEEDLPASYRTHGSEYETRVPLIILNAEMYPSADWFQYNMDLVRWVMEKPM